MSRICWHESDSDLTTSLQILNELFCCCFRPVGFFPNCILLQTHCLPCSHPKKSVRHSFFSVCLTSNNVGSKLLASCSCALAKPETHPTPSSSIHLQRFLNGPPSAWQGWTSNITLQKKWRERLGKFCITDWWETNWQQQQNAEANLMSTRQRDTQIERTAVKVTSQTPFKHRQSHCHPRKPSVSASMTERDWESKVEQV